MASPRSSAAKETGEEKRAHPDTRRTISCGKPRGGGGGNGRCSGQGSAMVQVSLFCVFVFVGIVVVGIVCIYLEYVLYARVLHYSRSECSIGSWEFHRFRR